MTQITAADWPIDPLTTSGDDLAAKLNALVSAWASSNSGAGRPPSIGNGGLWVKETGTGRDLMMFDGTDDVRLLTVTAAGLVSVAMGYTAAEIDAKILNLQTLVAAVSSVQRGFIVMWSGSIASIPAGYALCNGQNGTPNLLDRMVVAAGGAYAVAATGGSATVTLTAAQTPAHTHTFSGTTGNESADHSHSGWTDSQGVHSHVIHRDLAGSSGTLGNSIASNQGISNYAPVTTQAAGAHSHNVGTHGRSNTHTHGYSGTTSSIGSNAAHDNMSPYYALALIMKL